MRIETPTYKLIAHEQARKLLKEPAELGDRILVFHATRQQRQRQLNIWKHSETQFEVSETDHSGAKVELDRLLPKTCSIGCPPSSVWVVSV